MSSSKPNPNRKSFTLSLNLQLPRPSKDHGAPRPSAFSSPRSPHFPVSLHLKQEQPLLPIPLTDGLDPSDKMKLLRKTRKLSRILGEVPIPVSIEDGCPIADLRLEEPTPSTSASTSAHSSPARSPSVTQRVNTLTRSATVGHKGSVQQTEAEMQMSRTRSFASLHPLTTIPQAAVTTRPSPVSPVEFSWPERTPPTPASPTSPVSISASAASATATIAPLIRRNTPSRHDSTASSVLLLEPTPEQIQRARAAKLSRQLGENIPPELLRASKPLVQSPASELPIRQSSVKKGKDSSLARGNRERSNSKRRLSLDLTTVGWGSELQADPYLAELGTTRVFLKKSNTVSGRARPRTAEPSRLRPMTADSSDTDADLEDGDGEDDLTAEKQRALNVWRARKMAQMFGNDPPPALFQITNLRPKRSGDVRPLSLALDIPRRDWDLRMAVKSIPESLAPTSPNSDSGGNISPLVFADPDSSHAPPSKERKSEPCLDPTVESPLDTHQHVPLAIRLTSTLTSSSQQSISIANASTASLAQSHETSNLSHPPLTYSAPLSPSPPPFVNMFHWSPTTNSPSTPTATTPVPETPLTPTAAEPNPPYTGFRLRRLRAAKLSRFFGVGLKDISALVESPTASPSGSGRTPDAPPSLTKAAADTIPRPLSPMCMRGFAASGVDEPPPLRRPRKSGGSSRRSQSQTRSPRPSTECERSVPEPQMATVVQAASEEYCARPSHERDAPLAHHRSYSTTVEVASESGGKYSFLESGRRAPRKELEMHMAIKQLRKIK